MKGQYGDAVQVFRRLFQQYPEAVDYTQSRMLGLLLLANGDLSSYQAHCGEMMSRFRTRGSGDAAAVLACVLSPDSGVPITELRRLMPHMALIRKSTPYLSFFALPNGLLEYRAGRFSEAIEILSDLETDRYPAHLASAAATMSMACFKPGDAEGAAAQLRHARTMIEPNWPNERYIPERWDWLFADMLSKEAEGLLAERTKPPVPR